MIKISILLNLLFVGSSVTELNWWPSANIPATVSASYSILKVVISILSLTVICVTPALNKKKQKKKKKKNTHTHTHTKNTHNNLPFFCLMSSFLKMTRTQKFKPLKQYRMGKKRVDNVSKPQTSVLKYQLSALTQPF